MFRALSLVSGLTLVAGGALELTQSNFEAEVYGGKNAFVKYLAPW
jgi:hypothetical protein